MSEKAPEAFRTISEVAEDLDLPQHVLRFWETRFSQIRPMKRGGGRRYYRPEDVELLRGIRHILYGEGYTIKGAQRILKERGVRHVAAIGRGEDPDAGDEARQDIAALPTLKSTPADPLAEYAPKRVREQATRQEHGTRQEPATRSDAARDAADEWDEETEQDFAPQDFAPQDFAPQDFADPDLPEEPSEDDDETGAVAEPAGPAREADPAATAAAGLEPDVVKVLRSVLSELGDCRRLLREVREKARA